MVQSAKAGRGLLAALLLSATAACVSATASDPPTPQGWTKAEQRAWYEATQGSRLMPLSWFMALEQPGGGGLLSDQEYLTRTFGYLPSRADRKPLLPVGFAVDDNDDSQLGYSRLRWYAGQKSTERWVGLNCSACHTAELTHNGQRVRIDGGPGLVDFQSFIEAVDRALVATRDDPARFDRFAARVLGKSRDNRRNRDMLRAELDKLTAWQEKTARLNETPLRYGFARLDAFGHIYNKIAMFVRAELPTANPADAPVSYPFLWDIHRHDRLQWNGIAESRRINLGRGSLDVGALGRNAGEVIGVFGDVVAERPGGRLGGFRSSVYADNLNRMEEQLARLKPPKWPAAFGEGPADRQQLAAEGRALFGDKCVACHQPAPAGERVKVKMVPLFGGSPRNHTDPWMACNAFTYETATGVFEGTKSSFDPNQLYGPFAQNADLLKATVQRVILGKKPQLLGQAGATFLGINRPPRIVAEEAVELPPEVLKARRLEVCRTTQHPLLAYKGRPLEGIWATAPYLHNGSVPTLYDLLLPVEQRPAAFYVGTREFDPVKVGYRTDQGAPGNGFLFQARDSAGQPIAGNSNAGHEYGAATLTERQRRALVEYMKTF